LRLVDGLLPALAHPMNRGLILGAFALAPT
jgi:hypothetical protein